MRGFKILARQSALIFKNKTPRGGKRNLYQHPLRRISIKREGKEPIILVTNLLELPAEMISELYNERALARNYFNPPHPNPHCH